MITDNIKGAELDLTPKPVEYVTIETVDGEEITLEKERYEQLVKDHKQYGEFLY